VIAAPTPAFLPLADDVSSMSEPAQAHARLAARRVAELCVRAARTRFRRLYGHDVDAENPEDVGQYNVLILSLRQLAPEWWAETAPYVSLRGRMIVMDDYARTWADPRFDWRP
jgi:hypothetical protein